MPKRSDPDWEEHRACKRKIRYPEPPTDRAAWLRPYRCRFCDGWHVTSKPRTGRDKARHHEMLLR